MTTADHTMLAQWYRDRVDDAPADCLGRLVTLARLHRLAAEHPERERVLLRLRGFCGRPEFGAILRRLA